MTVAQGDASRRPKPCGHGHTHAPRVHKELQAELRKAGFPPVGGTNGSTKVWLDRFETNSAERDKALDILQRTVRNFDVGRGTSINPYLDKELRIMKPANPPSSK
ncbi:MAG: hypothetical protein WDN45_13130 [Caulobacteraceae bacterium]